MAKLNTLGMITIGQAPRTDIAPIIEKYIAGRAELVQVGVLDGWTKADIEASLSPVGDDYALTTPLANGESVVVSRGKIQPILQEKIDQLEAKGISQILILCTGIFPGLTTKSAHLIEPDYIITPTVKALAGDRRIGALVPLEGQKVDLIPKYDAYHITPFFTVASPYGTAAIDYEGLAKKFHDKVDLILLDSMGYSEEMRQRLAKETGLPVILSNAIMAKLVSEMI